MEHNNGTWGEGNEQKIAVCVCMGVCRRRAFLSNHMVMIGGQTEEKLVHQSHRLFRRKVKIVEQIGRGMQ